MGIVKWYLPLKVFMKTNVVIIVVKSIKQLKLKGWFSNIGGPQSMLSFIHNVVFNFGKPFFFCIDDQASVLFLL